MTRWLFRESIPPGRCQQRARAAALKHFWQVLDYHVQTHWGVVCSCMTRWPRQWSQAKPRRSTTETCLLFRYTPHTSSVMVPPSREGLTSERSRSRSLWQIIRRQAIRIVLPGCPPDWLRGAGTQHHSTGGGHNTPRRLPMTESLANIGPLLPCLLTTDHSLASP